MTFYDKLRGAWQANNSLVCVGLDPDPAKLPACVKSLEKPVFEFNKAIIDATKDLVCAYKPQAACYAAQNADDQLAETIRYIHAAAPSVPVILDAKRADIGNTTRMYVTEAFDRYQADAVTVNPYMGMDAIKPFLDCADKGVVVLCRTSNGGAKEIQELVLQNGEMLYQYLAQRISTVWNYNRNVLLVTGATCPEELGDIRKRVGDSVALLVPGIGAQGGDLEGVLRNGLTADRTGLVINSSRGIIFASSGEDFAEAARREALKLRDAINSFRG